MGWLLSGNYGTLKGRSHLFSWPKCWRKTQKKWSFKQSAPRGLLLTMTAYSFQRSRHNELRPKRHLIDAFLSYTPITVSLFFTDSIKAAAFSAHFGSEFNISYLVSRRVVWWVVNSEEGLSFFYLFFASTEWNLKIKITKKDNKNNSEILFYDGKVTVMHAKGQKVTGAR